MGYNFKGFEIIYRKFLIGVLESGGQNNRLKVYGQTGEFFDLLVTEF